MPDIPPYQRLDPNAQEWGRWVTDSAQSNKNAIESLQTNTRSANQSLAAQLNRLQIQVADLSERKTYFSGGSASLQLNSASGLTSLSSGAAIAFTLSTPRVLVVSGQAGYTSDLNVGAGGSLTADCYYQIEIIDTNTSASVYSASDLARSHLAAPSAGGVVVETRGALSSNRAVTLDPGSYYATSVLKAGVYQSGTAVPFVRVGDGIITISVTDPA